MATHALPSSHILGNDAPAYAPARPAFVRGLLLRLYVAVLVSQMRRAQREIDRVLGPGALQRARRGEHPPQI